MTDRALEELAARVEALTGPDRAIDGVIHETVTSFPPRDGGVGWSFGTLVVPCFPGWKELPFYTASTDAAMSLLRGSDLWAVGDDSEGPFARITPGKAGGGYLGSEQITVFAATPALALTAACLRAIASASKQQERAG